MRELIAEDASRTLEFMQEQLMVVDGLTAEICSNYVAKVNRSCQECLHGTDYFELWLNFSFDIFKNYKAYT